MLDTITDAVPGPGHILRLRYADGATVAVDFKPIVAQGGEDAALGGAEVFARVTIGDGGRFVEWPGAIDFCADALRLQGVVERDAGVPRAVAVGG